MSSYVRWTISLLSRYYYWWETQTQLRYFGKRQLAPRGPWSDGFLLSKSKTVHVGLSQDAVVMISLVITDKPQLRDGSVTRQANTEQDVTWWGQFERVWHVQVSFHDDINWQQSTHKHVASDNHIHITQPSAKYMYLIATFRSPLANETSQLGTYILHLVVLYEYDYRI